MTNSAPMRPVEVNYVNADVKDLDSTDGYQFALPVRWTSHPSMNKAIGLRRLRYTPWWGCIGFTVTVYADDEETVASTWTTELQQFTSENTLQECLVALQTAASWTDGETKEVYQCILDYDAQAVKMNFTHSGDSVKFELTFDENKYQYCGNLLKLFNQQINTDDPITSLTSRAGTYLLFPGVWNRHDLYFHASFSDSTRQIIGVNSDFWPEPSVFYDGTRTSDDFTIRFTDDTVTSIVPRHGVLLVQFSLIYNHQKYLD